MLIYFLPIIIALGIVTSYQDIVSGKIRNTHLIAAACLGILIHALLYALEKTEAASIGFRSIETISALALGMIIWKLGWWGAGDAKLYAAFTLLMPYQQYTHRMISIPSIDIISNAVLPLFAYLALHMLFRTGKKQKKDLLIKSADPKTLGITLLMIFSLSWLIRAALSRAGIRPNYLIIIIILAGTYQMLGKIMEKNETIALLSLIAILRAFIDKQHVLRPQFLAGFFIITAGVIILMAFLRHGSESYKNTKFIYNLKPGDKLKQKITKEGNLAEGDTKKYKLLDIEYNSLTEQDINKLEKMHKTHKLHFNFIETYQKIPFALFIYFGILSTIICDGNIITFLRAVI